MQNYSLQQKVHGIPKAQMKLNNINKYFHIYTFKYDSVSVLMHQPENSQKAKQPEKVTSFCCCNLQESATKDIKYYIHHTD